MDIDFYKIAQNYFQGSITAEDEKLLSQFLQDSENCALFKKWSDEWHQTAKEHASDKTKVAWMRLMESQRQEEQGAQAENLRPSVVETRRQVPSRKRYWYYAAAVALLLIGIGSALWLFNNDTAEVPYMAQTGKHEQKTLTLPDGTQVTLNSESTLACADDFGQKDRRISFEGEAVFDVRKDAERPFVIQVGDYSVTVLGTHFNLSAYQQDNAYTLALIEGSVKVKYQQDSVIMQANEQVRFDRQTATFDKEAIQAASADAWTHGRIEFDNIILQDLVQKLERQYEVSIDIEDPQIAREQVYISVSMDEAFEDVCAAIEALLPVSISKRNDVYIITRQ